MKRASILKFVTSVRVGWEERIFFAESAGGEEVSERRRLLEDFFVKKDSILGWRILVEGLGISTFFLREFFTNFLRVFL